MKTLVSSIKTKLQLAFLALVSLSAIAGFLSYSSLHQIVANEALKSQTDQLRVLFAELRKQEKDFVLYDRKEVRFLETGEAESLQKHQQAMLGIKTLVSDILEGDQLDKEDALYAEIMAVDAAVDAYHKLFLQLVKSYTLRGFKDHGLEGEMREVIHQLQVCESKEEQWFALMLRRHEKDFFLRQDPKYIETLQKRAGEFIAFVKNSQLPHMNPAYKEKTIASINNYLRHFTRIAALEEEIGLNKAEGITGALSRQAESAEPLLLNMQEMIHEKNQHQADQALMLLLTSLLVMLAGGIGFSLLVTRKVSNPIIALSQLVENASIGDTTITHRLLAIKRNDELGKLITSFGGMFTDISQKVQEISHKNMVLQATARQEEERKWLSEGLATLEGIMAKQAHDLKLLCDEFLLHLVRYTQSSQAALFLKEENREGISCLQLQSCYAGSQKRYQTSRIAPGEGLVGTVWQEKEAFYMTDIPETYSRIRSGLGKAKPRAIYIVPAMLEKEVEAIVEIGSFRVFSENEQELIRLACKGLAGAVARVRMQENTQRLLEKAQDLTEELQQREEEMRQQLEELHASQEDATRVQKQLEQKVNSLQGHLQHLREYIIANKNSLAATEQAPGNEPSEAYWQELIRELNEAQQQHVHKLLSLATQEAGESL